MRWPGCIVPTHAKAGSLSNNCSSIVHLLSLSNSCSSIVHLLIPQRTGHVLVRPVVRGPATGGDRVNGTHGDVDGEGTGSTWPLGST